MSYQSAAGYAGDLLAADAYKLLAGDASSMLIDVRTQAEWTYVGVPDLLLVGQGSAFPGMAELSIDAGRQPLRCASVDDVGDRRRQTGSAARLRLSIGRQVAPSRSRDDKRGLGAVFQYL